jgi:hypothetical protein
LESPTLLPDGEGLALVREFPVPGIGAADLVGVNGSGELGIVECKLNSNPQIKREVVGQILAYAGGLWHMTYDEFASKFTRQAGMPFYNAVAQASDSDVDEGQLREALTSTLTEGSFRLIVAVDGINPELKLIIEYLNLHSSPRVSIVALELSYASDEDVEVLVPSVYGQEMAGGSRTNAGGHVWNNASFSQRVEADTSGAVREFIEVLLTHGSEKGNHAFYGPGVKPGLSYYYVVDGKVMSVWALYLRDPAPKVAISFGAISPHTWDKAVVLLKNLQSNLTLAKALTGMSESTLNRYPTISIDPYLIEPAAQAAFFTALDHLVEK